MATRKSGKELRAEHKDLMVKTKALQKRIIKRAEELIAEYPAVPYGKAKWKNNEVMTVGDYKRYYLITPKIALAIIEYVEQWIADQHPHKQTSIEFPCEECPRTSNI
jgi:hypothetical protein